MQLVAVASHLPSELRSSESRSSKCIKYKLYIGSQLWHLDGYDKLKPYGFAIHGCIDGYVTSYYTYIIVMRIYLLKLLLKYPMA